MPTRSSSDPAHDAAVELASIARGHILESVRQRAEAEHLRKQRDAARAILADALHAWCIDPACANDEAAES